MRAWNSDPAAVAFGRHNYSGHGYEGALVTYLTDGRRRSTPPSGVDAR